MAEDSGVQQGAVRDCGSGHGSVVRSATKDSGAQGVCEAGQWRLGVGGSQLGPCADGGSGLLGLG